MRKVIISIVVIAGGCWTFSGEGIAQSDPTNSDCMKKWVSADADRNGILDKNEDKERYFDRQLPSGMTRSSATGLTRDEFLTLCLGRPIEETSRDTKPDSVKMNQPGKEFPKDRGKGDLTPGKSTLGASEVTKRLESLGYREIQDLTLGSDGIWRGTALSGDGRKPIELDPQGDVVSK